MYSDSLVIGVLPIRRSFLNMEEALRQKTAIMQKISERKPSCVTIVNIDDLCANGIASQLSTVTGIIEKFKKHHINALFIPFCDFGEEQVAASVAKAFDVPVLVWGPRDEAPNTDVSRGRDTQCGMFAATKVLRRFNVRYSYIVNCATNSTHFTQGFDRFVRVAMIVKALLGLRIAKIGSRPSPFLSVATNEAALMRRFGITVEPISPSSVAKEALALIERKDSAWQDYLNDLRTRVDCSLMATEDVEKITALKLAIQARMEETQCTVAASECWSVFYDLLGVPPCVAMGELANEGLPVSCEADVNGSITMAILRACGLYQKPVFLADLTIRHPANDNAELLWHCGVFAYGLRASQSKPYLKDSFQRWELQQGELTLCRFDDAEDNYFLFGGKGKTVAGPETTGNYVWLEVNDWQRWEEALMFGPYIHHIGGLYGDHLPVLREAARYLSLSMQEPDNCSIRSL